MDKGEVRLADHTTAAWDRVYIYPPYTAEDKIEKDLGFKVSFPSSANEGTCLLVFTLNGNLVSAVEVKRNLADFASVGQQGGFRLEEARFAVKKDAGGWKHLSVVPSGAEDSLKPKP